LLLAARYGNRKLPAKPLSQGTFAGIPRAAKIFKIENYRQNLSRKALLPVFLSLVSDFAARRSLRKSKTTGKTPLPRHFCRYPARRENLQNRKLPAKPFSQGTFAGISQPSLRLCCSPLATEIENYRQNPSPKALLPVSRASRKSSKSKTTGKTFLPRHFCRYPARRENLQNRKLPAKPLSQGTFAGISQPSLRLCCSPLAAKILEIEKLPAKPLSQGTFAGISRVAKIFKIENYRQNLSRKALLPVFLSLVSDFAARRSLRKSKTTGKTPLPRHFCRYPARRENLQNRKLPAKPFLHGTFAGISQPSLRLCCSPLAAKILEIEKLPAKPLSQGTFAGISRVAKIFKIENYRQNLSRKALLPVFLSLVSDFAARRSLRKSKTTGKTPLPRHFCRYPARRENLQNRKLPAKPFLHGTFAGISQPSLRLCCSPLATEIENYRQNPSPKVLLPVSLAPRRSSKSKNYRQNLSPSALLPVFLSLVSDFAARRSLRKSKTTGKTPPAWHFCRYFSA